jgi:hypothetical protein
MRGSQLCVITVAQSCTCLVASKALPVMLFYWTYAFCLEIQIVWSFIWSSPYENIMSLSRNSMIIVHLHIIQSCRGILNWFRPGPHMSIQMTSTFTRAIHSKHKRQAFKFFWTCTSCVIPWAVQKLCSFTHTHTHTHTHIIIYIYMYICWASASV